MLKKLLACCFAAFLFCGSLSAQEIAATPAKPKKANDLLFQLKRAGVFEIFIQALDKSGWTDKIAKSTEGFTLLVPSDAAFYHVESVPKDKIFADKILLKNFMEQHIIRGIVRLEDLENMQSVHTESGLDIMVEKKKPLTLAQAPIVKANIAADNGIIHVLGSVRLVEK